MYERLFLGAVTLALMLLVFVFGLHEVSGMVEGLADVLGNIQP